MKVMRVCVCVCVYYICIQTAYVSLVCVSDVVGLCFAWSELDAVTQSSESANEFAGHVISCIDV